MTTSISLSLTALNSRTGNNERYCSLKEIYIPSIIRPSIPEVLILDNNHRPEVNVELVSSKPTIFGSKLKYDLLYRLIHSIPKTAHVTAYSTFALSVGFKDPNLPPRSVAGGPNDLDPYHGTALAIDDHHLLSSAHLLVYDTQQRKYPPDVLQYVYFSPIEIYLMVSIRVRHDHKNTVDRTLMFNRPDEKLDFEVEVLAYADGTDPKKVRAANGGQVDIDVDCVLLYSKRSLCLKNYPKPGRAHNPPQDKSSTSVEQNVSLLAYNGYPTSIALQEDYPNTPPAILHQAIRDLWIDRLSYATGKTEKGQFDINSIYHRISSYGGASGGPLMDEDGNVIGKRISDVCLQARLTLKGRVRS